MCETPIAFNGVSLVRQHNTFLGQVHDVNEQFILYAIIGRLSIRLVYIDCNCIGVVV